MRQDRKGLWGRGRVALVALLLALAPLASVAAWAQAAAPAAEAEGAAAPDATADAEAAAVDEQAPSAPAERVGPRLPAERIVALAWARPGSLEERVAAVRGAAFERGVRSLDGVARSLLLDAQDGDALARARAAVSLAPDLPDARLALARAHWERRSPLAALGEATRALGAVPRHLEARAWFEATAFQALALAALLAAAIFLLAAALAVAPSAARQLAAALPGVPLVSAFAWLAVLFALPVALGEGWAGLALGASALALAYGSFSARLATLAAVALLVAGLHPLTGLAAGRLGALVADPAAWTAWSVERDFGTAFDRRRLERVADRHPQAARALALDARREGDLGEADRRFRELLESRSPSPALLHNAANVRFALGRDAEAIALYERAIAERADASSLWNLAQAHGRSIHIDEQDAVLRRAQALDATLVAELTAMAGAGAPVVLDRSLAAADVGADAAVPDPTSAYAARLRAPFAPGHAGRGPGAAALLFGAVALLAVAVGHKLRGLPSASADEDLYAGIARVLQGREATDPSLRRARLSALRERRARYDRVARVVALLVPGAAGVLGRHPLLGLGASVSFALAVTGFAARAGVVPDALAAGQTASLFFGGVGVLAVVLYLGFTGVAVVLRERS